MPQNKNKHSGASIPTGAIRRSQHEKPAMIQGGAMAWSTCLACKRPRFETPMARSRRKASAETQPSALSNFLRPGRKKTKKNPTPRLFCQSDGFPEGGGTRREELPSEGLPAGPHHPRRFHRLARPALGATKSRVTRASPPLTSRGGRRRGRGREGGKEGRRWRRSSGSNNGSGGGGSESGRAGEGGALPAPEGRAKAVRGHRGDACTVSLRALRLGWRFLSLARSGSL